MSQIHQNGQGDNIAGDKVIGDKITTQNNFTNNLQGANIDNFANSLSDNAKQVSGVTTADLVELIAALRDQAQCFPEAQQEDILIELEDLEEQANKPADQRNTARIKKRLIALLTTAVVIGGSIATATDFTNNITDLGQKFGLELELPPGL